MLNRKFRTSKTPTFHILNVTHHTAMEKIDTKRFTGTATVTYSYRTEFLVECPKCGGSAIVNCKNPYFLNEGTLNCKSCNHTEKAKDLKRYNIIVKRNCDNCGKAFEKTIPNSKERANEITIPCPHCGVTRTFEPRNEETQLQYNSRGSVCDPIFNLPLWLQTDVRGNVFWANNRNHLEHIREYVDSKLRERQTMEYTTMVERLPNFIKSAKNRDHILKAIDKLMRK